jgi:hypothetical protein
MLQLALFKGYFGQNKFSKESIYKMYWLLTFHFEIYIQYNNTIFSASIVSKKRRNTSNLQMNPTKVLKD